MNKDRAIYKDTLLDHFKNPRNFHRMPFGEDYATARGRNPKCGDDVEVGFKIVGNKIQDIGFRGRGCSICIASTSIMTEALSNKDIVYAKDVFEKVKSWSQVKAVLPDTVASLEAISDSPARMKCALLGWNALSELLADQ